MNSNMIYDVNISKKLLSLILDSKKLPGLSIRGRIACKITSLSLLEQIHRRNYTKTLVWAQERCIFEIRIY